MVATFLLIVASAASSRVGAQSWTLSPEPTLRIGDEARSEYQFNRVGHVRRLSDNRILVTTGPNIRFFDRAGQYLNRAGGDGQGPGEFQTISDLIVLPGDTLLVRNQRLIVWLDPRGRFVRQVNPDLSPLASGSRFSEEYTVLPNGNMLAQQLGRMGARPTTLFRMPLRYSLLNVRSGRVTPLHRSGAIAQKFVNGVAHAMRFSPHAQHAVGLDRFFVGDNDSTTIHAFTLDGTLLRTIRMSIKPVPVTRADIEGIKEREKDLNRRLGRPAQEVDQVFARAPMPTRHPYWGKALVGRDGKLWVSDPERLNAHARVWTGYDRDGKSVGSLTLPLRYTLKEIGADYILGVQRDEDGVESIVMYSIRAPR